MKPINREVLEELFNFGWSTKDISKFSNKKLIESILECQEINLSEGYRWLNYDTIQELKMLLKK